MESEVYLVIGVIIGLGIIQYIFRLMGLPKQQSNDLPVDNQSRDSNAFDFVHHAPTGEFPLRVTVILSRPISALQAAALTHRMQGFIRQELHESVACQSVAVEACLLNEEPFSLS